MLCAWCADVCGASQLRLAAPGVRPVCYKMCRSCPPLYSMELWCFLPRRDGLWHRPTCFRCNYLFVSDSTAGELVILAPRRIRGVCFHRILPDYTQ